MQAGFALVYTGSIRFKNRQSIALKTLFGILAGFLAFWLTGSFIIFGHESTWGQSKPSSDIFEAFSTTGLYFSSQGKMWDSNQFTEYFLQVTLASIVVTISLGPLAERVRIDAFIGFAFLLAGFIFPIIIKWTWAGGFLGDRQAEEDQDESVGFHDFAGAGIIHLVGGAAGFMGAAILGPRHGNEKNPGFKKDIRQDRQYNVVCEDVRRGTRE